MSRINTYMLSSGGYFLPTTFSRYVFFDTLLQNKIAQTKNGARPQYGGWVKAKRSTAWMAAKSLNKYTGTEQFKSLDSISANELFNKLGVFVQSIQAMADKERQKEEKYIELLREKLKKNPNLKLFENLSKDDLQDPKRLSEFIVNFNLAKTELKELQGLVESEYTRLQENIKKYNEALKYQEANPNFTNTPYKNMNDEQKEMRSRLFGNYERNIQSKAIQMAQQAIKRLYYDGTKTSFATIIADYVWQQNLSRFIQIANDGTLALDTSEVKSLVTAITVKAMENFIANNGEKYLSEIFQHARSNDSKRKSFNEYLKKSSAENSKLPTIDELLDMPRLSALLNNDLWVKNISVNFSKEIHSQAKVASQKSTSGRKQRENLEVATAQNIISSWSGFGDKAQIQQFAKIIASEDNMKVNVKLVQPSGKYLYNEAARMVSDTIFNEGIFSAGAYRGGSAQKVDCGAAVISITTEQPNVSMDILSRVLNLNEELNTTMKKVHASKTLTTRDKANAVFNAYDQLLNQLKSIAKEINKTTEDLDLFYINYSNKLYDSFGRTRKAFDAGSLGANFEGALEKINLIEEILGTGLTQEDAWLITAIINCADNTIMGTSQKSLIEEYLAAICTTLLFDDYMALAGETLVEPNNWTFDSSVNTLHVLDLQGGITVPLSYILQTIVNNFTKILSKAEADVQDAISSNEIIKVDLIRSGVPSDENWKTVTADTWSGVTSSAIAATDIKAVFLGNFLDILGQLGSAFSDL